MAQASGQKVFIGGATISSGAGAPAFIAEQGSIYIRTDGSGVATRLYINTTGAAVWTAISTVA